MTWEGTARQKTPWLLHLVLSAAFFFSSVDSLSDGKAAVWAEFIDYSPTKVGRW